MAILKTGYNNVFVACQYLKNDVVKVTQQRRGSLKLHLIKHMT